MVWSVPSREINGRLRVETYDMSSATMRPNRPRMDEKTWGVRCRQRVWERRKARATSERMAYLDNEDLCISELPQRIQRQH